MPNPMECEDTVDPERAASRRRLGCRHETHCLTIADGRRWAAFTCVACLDYKAPTVHDLNADAVGLVDVLCEVAYLMRNGRLRNGRLRPAARRSPGKERSPAEVREHLRELANERARRRAATTEAPDAA